MSDMAFEQMLAEYNQTFKDATEFNNWMPPDGDYIATIIKKDKGVSEKDGKKLGWWKLTARLECPEKEALNGQEFSLGFYNTNAIGIFKGQIRALNKGVAVESIEEANTIFESALGKILSVKIITTVSKKNGQEYPNCYIQEVIATEEATGGEPAEVPF